MDSVRQSRSGRFGGRVTWVVVGTLVAAAVLTGVGWATSGLVLTWDGPAADDQEVTDSNAQWSGTVHGSQTRSTGMVSASYAMRGSFWFRVDDEGRIRGRANVVYEPKIDVTRLDAAVKYVRDTGNAAAGLLTGGPILNLATRVSERGLATYTGLKASPERPQYVQSGRIEGRSRHGEMRLRWADEQAESIPFDVTMQYLKQDEKISEDVEMPIAQPWLEPGKVFTDQGPMVESVYEPDPKKKDDVKVTTTSTWTAHRVGG